jgi:hypothetical protein
MSEDLLYERDPSLFRNSNGRVHGQRTKVCIEFYDAQNRAALQFGTVRSFVSSKARKVAPLAPADAAGKVVAVSVGSKRYGTALGGLGLANPHLQQTQNDSRHRNAGTDKRKEIFDHIMHWVRF